MKRRKIVCNVQGLSEGKTGNKKREREREQRKPWIVLLLTPLSFPSRVAGRACRVVWRVTTSKWVFSNRAEIRGCVNQELEHNGCLSQFWLRRPLLPQHLPGDFEGGHGALQAVWADQVQLRGGGRGALGVARPVLQDPLQVDQGNRLLAARCRSPGGRGGQATAPTVPHSTRERPPHVSSHLRTLLCSLSWRMRPLPSLPGRLLQQGVQGRGPAARGRLQATG